jgi:MarR family transcriptional regulator for hemolysin
MDSYYYQNSLCFIINSSAKMFIKALDSELRKSVGITFSQWKILVMLSIKDGTTQKEIANGLGLEGATLIPIIDKMEKDGLVVRKVDLADRRNNRIYRTDKASELWTAMVDCALKIREISVRDIPSTDVTIMRDSLQKVYKNLETHVNVTGEPTSAAAAPPIMSTNKITSTNSTNQEN